MVELWSLYELVVGFIRTDEDGVVIVDNVEVGIRSVRFGHSGISVKEKKLLNLSVRTTRT